MKYRFLEHTADAMFEAYGKNLEEAFINSALALTKIITDHNKVKPKIKKRIKVKSESLESLLYDFLERFLILLDSESFLLHKVIKLKIRNNRELEAEIIGDKVSKRYVIDTHVKAVTYNDMLIKKVNNKYKVRVVVDL